VGYLRFTPEEFQSIWRVCRPVSLSDDRFPVFQRFLVQSLLERAPELAQRVARLRKYQVGIIFEYLKERRRFEQTHDPEPRPAEVREHGLTLEDFRAVVEVSGECVFGPRLLGQFRAFLVRRFRGTIPALSDKLARLSDGQMEGLYDLVQSRRGRST
jgi:hypothetical protein